MDMILRAVFLVSTHNGIMQLQVKGGGWFKGDAAKEGNLEMQGHGLKNQFTLVVGSTASGKLLPAQLIFQGKTERACPNNMKYKASSVPPAPGGKKKEREASAAGDLSSKVASSFVPDFPSMPNAFKFRGIGSVSVTHDHWADPTTSMSWVEDVVAPYYSQVCAEMGLNRNEHCRRRAAMYSFGRLLVGLAGSRVP